MKNILINGLNKHAQRDEKEVEELKIEQAMTIEELDKSFRETPGQNVQYFAYLVDRGFIRSDLRKLYIGNQEIEDKSIEVQTLKMKKSGHKDDMIAKVLCHQLRDKVHVSILNTPLIEMYDEFKKVV